MSPKNTLLAAGLTALGLAGSATRLGAQDPPPRAVRPAPAAPKSAAPSPTVLLLSNGDVLEGEIQEDDTGFGVVVKGIGVIRKTRRQVVGGFASLGDAYRFRLAQVAEGDPDERLKLAQWCLAHNLTAEARVELEAAASLSPDDPRPKAMIFRLDAQAARSAAADPGVVRTGAEGPAPATETEGGEPGRLKLDELRDRMRAGKVASGVPIIFDLPAPVAFRRYQEFARSVHPALQEHCARCHDEAGPGNFQLIRARTRRDLANDVLVGYNLDATLALISRDDPARSPLLTSALMPHRPTGRPVLNGPNHPSYRALAEWVAGLRIGAPAEGVVPARFTPQADAPSETGEGFAVDRLAPGRPGMPPLPPSSQTRTPEPPGASPADRTAVPGPRLLPGSVVVSGEGNPPPPGATFPTSPLQGGADAAKVVIRGVARHPDGTHSPVVTPRPAGNKPTGPPTPSSGTMRLPNGQEIPLVDTRAEPPADESSRKKKPSRKVDPRAVEKFLSDRAPKP